MTLSQRRQHLIQQINTINDENVLIMIEEELSLHVHNKIDLDKELNPSDLEELIMLANEPSDKNTVSMDEYRKATERWRTK